mgnify:CR=1 FL=1
MSHQLLHLLGLIPNFVNVVLPLSFQGLLHVLHQPIAQGFLDEKTCPHHHTFIKGKKRGAAAGHMSNAHGGRRSPQKFQTNSSSFSFWSSSRCRLVSSSWRSWAFCMSILCFWAPRSTITWCSTVKTMMMIVVEKEEQVDYSSDS